MAWEYVLTLFLFCPPLKKFDFIPQQAKSRHILLIILLMLYPWVSYAASGHVVKVSEGKLSYADALRVVITAIWLQPWPDSRGRCSCQSNFADQQRFSPGSVGFMLTYGVIGGHYFYITGIVLAGFFCRTIIADRSGTFRFFNAYAWQNYCDYGGITTYF
ncbi:MAG: hypothetical protein IPL08_04815 [Saprospiraceae bacterium]|nr:hypothetical protein [Saprospiraceae bacterium]